MLFDSSVFAVMSVQNSINILERAFRAYDRSDSWKDVQDAMMHVNYGNNKMNYIEHNHDVIMSDSKEIIDSLERGDVWLAVRRIVEKMKGVSWIKGAFVPAMLGFTEVMCIDTNVAQMVPDESVQASEYKSEEEYHEAVNRVMEEFPDLSEELSPFMLQWVIFDANRGEGVARHEEWFNAILPGSSFSRQASLNSF